MSGIDTLPPLRDVIATHDLRARKSLGQNFLLDLNLTAKIARQAGDLSTCDVLEIGRSSIRIMVEVWINSPHDGEPLKVTEGEFVFVAIDEAGRTRAIKN